MQLKTHRYGCGCIKQYRVGGRINHIHCGNEWCWFDENGTYRKTNGQNDQRNHVRANLTELALMGQS